MNDQRIFPEDKGEFGGKGLRKDLSADSSQSTVVTIVAVINWVAVLFVVSELGQKDVSGEFRFMMQAPGWLFYLLAILAVVWSLGCSLLVRLKDSSTRWGARVFVCYLPALFIAYLFYIAVLKALE